MLYIVHCEYFHSEIYCPYYQFSYLYMETPIQTGEVPHTTLLTFEKSERNQVKVRESIFKDREYIDIRVFNKNKEGEFIPTKKGVTLPKDMMKEVIRGLAKLKI